MFQMTVMLQNEARLNDALEVIHSPKVFNIQLSVKIHQYHLRFQMEINF